MFEPETWHKLGAGGSGAALAAWFARATGMELLFMFLGGLSASWFLGPLVSEHFGLGHQQAAVGFAVGFLALIVLRKLMQVIDSFPAESIGGAIATWFKKKLGVESDKPGAK